MPAAGSKVVTKHNEVSLGGYKFPIMGAVRRMNISVPPNPIIFGDSTRRGDSQAMSEQIQSSNLGGSGVFIADSRTEFDVNWTSEAETRYNHAITLPPQTVSMGKPSGLTDEDITASIAYRNVQYFVFSDEVYTWEDADQEWSSLEYTLPGTPSDAVVWSGYLYVATSGGYSRRDSSGTWTDVSDDAEFLTVWDGKLFRLAQSSTGWDLYSLTTPAGAWSSVLASINSDVVPTQMVVYRDASGATAIYVVTRSGLWVYNADSTRFDQTEIQWPNTVYDSKATVFRDGKLYCAPGGMGLLAVQSGSQFVVSAVGLDTKDGVPEEEIGYIGAVASDQNWVLALTVSAEVEDEQDEYEAVFEPFPGRHQWSSTNGVTVLRAYANGWHRLWTSPSIGVPGSVLVIGSAYDTTRVYWSAGGQAYYQQLDLGFFNPRQIGTRSFAAGPVDHITSWFDFGAPTQDKIHGHFLAETLHCSTDDTIEVYYATDLSTSWTLLDTITSDDLHEFQLGGPEGLQARYFRFRFRITRNGVDETTAPVLVFWASQFMRVLPETPGFAFTINLRETYGGVSSAEMQHRLFQLSDWKVTPNLIKFGYTDHLDTSSRTYYGRITRISGGEWSGQENRGQGTYQVSFICPYVEDAIEG